MKKALPNFNHQALAGYMPIQRTMDEIMRDLVAEAQSQTQNQHMKHWYTTKNGMTYLYYRRFGGYPEA